MSHTEIAVIVLGLLLGYWLVSFFTSSGKQNKTVSPPPEAVAPWHEVLQVSVDASIDEIRAAYQAERDKYLPEKVQALGPEFGELAQRKSVEIEAAYRAALQARGVDA